MELKQISKPLMRFLAEFDTPTKYREESLLNSLQGLTSEQETHELRLFLSLNIHHHNWFRSKFSRLTPKKPGGTRVLRIGEFLKEPKQLFKEYPYEIQRFLANALNAKLYVSVRDAILKRVGYLYTLQELTEGTKKLDNSLKKVINISGELNGLVFPMAVIDKPRKSSKLILISKTQSTTRLTYWNTSNTFELKQTSKSKYIRKLIKRLEPGNVYLMELRRGYTEARIIFKAPRDTYQKFVKGKSRLPIVTDMVYNKTLAQNLVRLTGANTKIVSNLQELAAILKTKKDKWVLHRNGIADIGIETDNEYVLVKSIVKTTEGIDVLFDYEHKEYKLPVRKHDSNYKTLIKAALTKNTIYLYVRVSHLREFLLDVTLLRTANTVPPKCVCCGVYKNSVKGEKRLCKNCYNYLKGLTLDSVDDIIHIEDLGAETHSFILKDYRFFVELDKITAKRLKKPLGKLLQKPLPTLAYNHKGYKYKKPKKGV